MPQVVCAPFELFYKKETKEFSSLTKDELLEILVSKDSESLPYKTLYKVSSHPEADAEVLEALFVHTKYYDAIHMQREIPEKVITVALDASYEHKLTVIKKMASDSRITPDTVERLMNDFCEESVINLSRNFAVSEEQLKNIIDKCVEMKVPHLDSVFMDIFKYRDASDDIISYILSKKEQLPEDVRGTLYLHICCNSIRFRMNKNIFNLLFEEAKLNETFASDVSIFHGRFFTIENIRELYNIHKNTRFIAEVITNNSNNLEFVDKLRLGLSVLAKEWTLDNWFVNEFEDPDKANLLKDLLIQEGYPADGIPFSELWEIAKSVPIENGL